MASHLCNENLFEPFPENLEINNGNYSKECRFIFEKLWEQAAYEGHAIGERLHTVFSELNNLYGLDCDETEEVIFRPDCTDDVEKTIYRLFDELGEKEEIPWHGHTHETYQQFNYFM